MLDRHLRSDEIDLLLDGEEGFGVTPLRAHVRSCIQCRMDLDRAREVVVLLDGLPDFAPSSSFADKVMSQVQVFEPWHAAALNTASKFVPTTRPARVAAGIGAAASAGLLTAAGAWAVSRADIGFLLAQVFPRLCAITGSAAGQPIGCVVSATTEVCAGERGIGSW